MCSHYWLCKDIGGGQVLQECKLCPERKIVTPRVRVEAAGFVIKRLSEQAITEGREAYVKLPLGGDV
jgi:hypothetical protein